MAERKRKEKTSPYRPGMTIQEMYEARPKAYLAVSFTLLLMVVIVGWSSTALADNSSTSSDGVAVIKSIFYGLTHPELSVLFDFSRQGLPALLLETMCIAFLGTIVGAVLAIPFAFLGASNVVPTPIAMVFRTIVMAIRTIPALVYGLMFIRVTGPGPFAGLLTMSVCSIGMISKQFIESIEDIDKGILESLDAIGCNVFEKIRYGIIPQIAPDFASTLIYRFDMNLRDSSTLGIVGAGGIGAPLIFAMGGYKWQQTGAILLELIILILIVEWISNKIRNTLAHGKR